jgi:hypothetical protein
MFNDASLTTAQFLSSGIAVLRSASLKAFKTIV